MDEEIIMAWDVESIEKRLEYIKWLNTVIEVEAPAIRKVIETENECKKEGE